MKIQSVGVVNQSAPNISANKNFKNSQPQKPSFGFNLQSAISTTWKSADEISSSLSKNYGMSTEFRGNDLVANMVERTVNIFKSIFHTSFLPKVVKFEPLNGEIYKNTLGLFCPSYEIIINSNQDRFYSTNSLRDKSIEEGSQDLEWINILKYPFFSTKSFHPTKSELNVFVHEFAHCAHYQNVSMNFHEWNNLEEIPVPDFYERVLNLKKIGKYATQDGSIYEVIAESLTRQILEYPETINYNNKSSAFDDYDENLSLFDFPDIPSTNAQKFLRAVWNGEVEEAKKLRYDVSHESYDKRSDDEYDFMMHSIAAITGW